MIEFGKTLRAAREAKGYTISQIAEMTHMAPSTVSELESENFTRIAAPIYGRGFVKLYCGAVGLEAKPMVDEFMEIFSGNRDTGILERALPTGNAPDPAPAESPAEPVTPAVVDRAEPPADEFRPTDELELVADPAPEAPSDFTAEPQPAQPAFSRYASPLHEEPAPRTFIPGPLMRLATAGIALLAVLVAVGYGLRALYRATSSDPLPETSSRVETPAPMPVAAPAAQPDKAQSATPPSQRSAAPRTPQKIPSLYID